MASIKEFNDNEIIFCLKRNLTRNLSMFKPKSSHIEFVWNLLR